MRISGFTQALQVCLLATSMFGIASSVRAQVYEAPSTWGGDFWSRPRLTGDWGGFRDALAKRGIVLDIDLLSTPQYVLSGGRHTAGGYWGNADYTLNIDTDKLGLWPGGFFKFSGDSGFGNNAFADSGAFAPINAAALFPAPNDRTTALTNATFTQFFSPQFGLVAGKINVLDLAKTEFHGDYATQFLNLSFVTPMTLDQVPLSAFGGGAIVIPTQNVTLSTMVLDANGSATSNDLAHAFSDGVTMVGNGQLTISPFGLVGHQRLGFSWSSKNRFSLEQDPSNIALLLLRERFPRLADPGPILDRILERFFPALLTPVQPATRRSDGWSVNYSFDQYFWQPNNDRVRGIGLFFSFGVSDGNPNPVKYSFVAGIGGKRAIRTRADDSFGIGFARTEFSSDFVPFLRQRLNLGLQHEDAIEMYYTASITPWLSVSPDLQIVNPGLEKALPPSGQQLTNVSTAVIAGLRVRTRF